MLSANLRFNHRKIKNDAPSRLKTRVGTGAHPMKFLTHYTYDFAALYRTYTLFNRIRRCRLCWTENGSESVVFERSEFRRFPIF